MHHFREIVRMVDSLKHDTITLRQTDRIDHYHTRHDTVRLDLRDTLYVTDTLRLQTYVAADRRHRWVPTLIVAGILVCMAAALLWLAKRRR